jgi:hypothetical protein
MPSRGASPNFAERHEGSTFKGSRDAHGRLCSRVRSSRGYAKRVLGYA